MTMTANRHRLPWSMSETNRLYNEYEIKQLPIESIAELHARTEYAILHKLAQECIINPSWNNVNGWNNAPKEIAQYKSKYVYDDSDDSDEDETYDDENDSDYEESVVSDTESLEDCDDPNDSDYEEDEEEDEEEEEDDEDYVDEDDESDFDAYSLSQKATLLRQFIDAARKYIFYSNEKTA